MTDKAGGPAPAKPPRRGFLSISSSAAMLAGLVGGYGAFALIAGRFLYPARPRPKRWMFVTRVADMKPGDAMRFRLPSGATVNVARQGSAGGVEDFIALSSTCPHLGCQVHWEAANDRFFCPCHNGTFDRAGKGTGGPPGDAGQSLPVYPLRVDKGLLFIQAPVDILVGEGDGVVRVASSRSAPGHDPCLDAGARPLGQAGHGDRKA